MFAVFVASALAVPFAPGLAEPGPDGWSPGSGAYFGLQDGFSDDSGAGFGSLTVQFRADDGGYGAMSDTTSGSQWGLVTASSFPQEGRRWCWRAQFTNDRGEVGPFSAERCFRTDWTPPTSPRMDAGTQTTSGHLVIPYTPGTDALSGIAGYQLRTSPVGLDHWSYYAPQLSTANPFDTFLGEGTWEFWLEARDLAGNLPVISVAPKPTVIVIANPTLPVPAPPVFRTAVSNNYGESLSWDASIPAAEGWVCSFCYLDAGCVWHNGFPARSSNMVPEEWVQMEGEGNIVARVAVVQGGSVGPWSSPSQVFKLDRTPPPTPTNLSVTPALSQAGPITLRWDPVPGDFVGPSTIFVEERGSDGGAVIVFSGTGVTSRTLSPREGRWSYRVWARDVAQNESGRAGPVAAVIDSTGPIVQAPTYVAAGADGGAVVSLSWTPPVDLLTTVTSVELLERRADAGLTVIPTANTSAQRVIGAGRWTWSVRAVDEGGNASVSAETVALDVGVSPSITNGALIVGCGATVQVPLAGSGDPPLTWSFLSGPAGATVSPNGVLNWTAPAAPTIEQVQVSLRNPFGVATGVVTVDVRCADGGVTDAGAVDAGLPDAGTADAGASDGGSDAGPDAGTSDAGTSDAGTSDAGTSDAGTPDAGTSDAGTSDAGTSDAGGGAREPVALSVGCGCSSAVDPTMLTLLVGIFLNRARRRR